VKLATEGRRSVRGNRTDRGSQPASLDHRRAAANSALTEENGKLTAANTALSDENSKLTAANTALTTSNTTLTSELAATNQTIADRDARIATLETDLQSADQTIAARDATIAALRADLGTANQTIVERNTRIATLEALGDPTFAIPGATPAEQIQNLIAAINALNPGQRLPLYKNLGGNKNK